MGWGKNKGHPAGAAAATGKGPSYSKVHPTAVPGWQVQAMINQASMQGALAASSQPYDYFDMPNKGNGKGWGKGNGKNGGKSQANNTNNPECFLCKWESCWAARNKRPTFTGSVCFTCKKGKSEALNPPLAEMTEWAYQQKLGIAAKPKTETKGAGKGGNRKNLSEEEKETLKVERKAELDAGKRQRMARDAKNSKKGAKGANK